MDNDAELEMVRKLENFRMEIEGIKNRIASKDATIAKIENVSDLQKEEMEVWEKLKVSLRKFLDLVSKEENKDFTSLNSLMVEFEEIGKSFNVQGVENKNKKSFYNWLNNRLNALINYVQLTLDGGDFAEDVKGEAERIGMSS